MSNKSRRRTSSPRRRVSVAPGVFSAVAGTILAAAGIAWVGETSGGSSGSHVYVADPSGGGTANVNDDPYVYDDAQSDFICHEAPGAFCGQLLNI